MAVTLADVARRAGVSPATASRAMNGRNHVSPSARERVASAMRELDFTPNATARSLSMARTGTVALLVHQPQYPGLGEGTFGARVLIGASRALRARGYALLYSATEEDDADALIRMPAASLGRSDGLLLLGPVFRPEAIRAVAGAGRPMVLIDNWLPGVDAVLADNHGGMRRLTMHLIRQHRYRRIALLAGPAAWTSTAERVSGHQAAMSSAGLTTHVIHAPGTTVRDGLAAFGRLPGGGTGWDAVMTVNDAMAIGALRRRRGLDRAARPAVVGFDDSAWASLADPPLTTVAVDAAGMGAVAAHRLVDHLEGLAAPGASPIRQPARLRIRRSCGCPTTEPLPAYQPAEAG